MPLSTAALKKRVEIVIHERPACAIRTSGDGGGLLPQNTSRRGPASFTQGLSGNNASSFSRSGLPANHDVGLLQVRLRRRRQSHRAEARRAAPDRSALSVIIAPHDPAVGHVGPGRRHLSAPPPARGRGTEARAKRRQQSIEQDVFLQRPKMLGIGTLGKTLPMPGDDVGHAVGERVDHAGRILGAAATDAVAWVRKGGPLIVATM